MGFVFKDDQKHYRIWRGLDMGCYEPDGYLKFEGTNSEKQMMEV